MGRRSCRAVVHARSLFDGAGAAAISLTPCVLWSSQDRPPDTASRATNYRRGTLSTAPLGYTPSLNATSDPPDPARAGAREIVRTVSGGRPGVWRTAAPWPVTALTRPGATGRRRPRRILMARAARRALQPVQHRAAAVGACHAARRTGRTLNNNGGGAADPDPAETVSRSAADSMASARCRCSSHGGNEVPRARGSAGLLGPTPVFDVCENIREIIKKR